MWTAHIASPVRGALSHVRVLDLSRVLAGPWATQTLADFGADVIKVERPQQGDDTRGWAESWGVSGPHKQDKEGNNTKQSAYFLSANRGKRAITCDITRPEGQELIRQLAAKCDVVVENFKAGGLAKYGLDYASLKQTGPRKDQAGYDFLLQGMSGLMSITGDPQGHPMKVGVAIVDIMTGLYATSSILAALLERDAQSEGKREGQHIDLSLFDVSVAFLANQASNYLVSGKAPQRMGNYHPNIAPYQSFEASDGYFILAVGNDSQFAKFCATAGKPELAADPRFITNAKRVENRKALESEITELTKRRTQQDWIGALKEVGVPCGQVNDIAQAFSDPQLHHRNMFLHLDHPASGADAPVPLMNSPIHMSRTPPECRLPPPALGEHTDEVLRELLSMRDAQIQALRDRSVL
ncbi:oxidoreductase, short chain dehydrogenase/reductase superfamily protein [Acanthamoeba castellanii str. Neff]|uniref:Oxidoreductase, short chain dehydrogenase/reductase superfamily protein n=1 Tax=Acanthamoeba castellanii (strain ATCC 30010 / Neff) TaxID=1257118 RepID=L8HFN0_ACACF|nr:oxidoreductase, short chain dehydrogenase/reductase superfamily protein [Acanthamoeba castellanii str. Neff]ELR23538.1 oxidoreductase, short chain dehydrogenase/reductase superfamily protein [Acanthamoeba castellanii str. Neff]